MHRTQAVAQTSRCIGIVDTSARLPSRRGSMDTRRRHTPQRILVRHQRGVLGRLRRNAQHRVRPHQQEHHHRRLQTNPPQQRGVLHARQGVEVESDFSLNSVV